MDSFELNKIIGAFLGVVFIVFSVSLISDAIFSSPAPETPGYAIAVPEGGTEGGGEAEPTVESVLPLLASADPAAGENVFKRCQACHTDQADGPNKVGPNLWGVVDRPIASHEGFSYSGAMKEFSEGGQKHWTYENLDHFLLSPKGLVPGTAMSFAGLKNVQDRANVIAYLRTTADQPVPLPEAAPTESEGSAAAPAEGGAQAAPAEDGGAPAEEAAPAEGAVPAEGAAPAENTSPAEGAPAPAESAPAEGTTAPAQPDGGSATGESDAAPEDGAGETQPAPAQ
ncbi:c-type cytochrome [Chelativorans sp. AA-79]|uniref:c-type cytochrome n=1 Tax=Chelativorans sp. AA-79 TaxID=3028735 RepID=UPI0023F7561C|nr:c-type cytochrome [Chelativorans sp. AA-79]WEX09384.1 c-type cytochrome [Chelativorans sp. AA-79]